MAKSRQQRSAPDSRIRSTRPVNTTFKKGSTLLSRSQKQSRQDGINASIRQQELQKRSRQARRRAKVLLIAGAALLLLLLVRLTIRHVHIVSSQSLPEKEAAIYQEKASKLLMSHAFFSQIWTLNEQAFKQDFKRTFPEIKEVSLKSRAPFRAQLDVAVTFREPVFKWHDASTAKKYLDTEGAVFEHNQAALPDEDLVIVYDESGLLTDVGQLAIPTSTVRMIAGVPEALRPLYGVVSTKKQSNIHLIKKVVVPQSAREFHVYLKGTRYYIKFNTSRDFNEQIGDLKALQRYLKKRKITPRQYIDVRLPKKAYYK